MARVRARIRPGGAAAASQLRIGDLCLDLQTHQVTADGRKANLSAREFALLRPLAAHPGQTLSRQELLSMAWGMDFDPQTNSSTSTSDTSAAKSASPSSKPSAGPGTASGPTAAWPRPPD